MFTNQDYNHLHQAISLKSVLQEISAREAGITTDIESNSTTHLNLKEINNPASYSQPVELSFAPHHGQIIALKDEYDNQVFGKVVIPDSPDGTPYIQKLSLEEAASLKGTRQAVGIIQSANRITAHPTQPIPKFKLPIFFEPGERLVFAIYNRILMLGRHDYSAKVYIIELILMALLGFLAIFWMWLYALQVM